MTCIYAVNDEVFLSAPRDVLDEVVCAIEIWADSGLAGMPGQLRDFANSLRAHAQHLPEVQQEKPGSVTAAELAEGWLDV